MDHGVISFTIWMKSPMTLKTAKVNNNHQHPSSTKILLLHPSHPIKSLEAEELFLPSINCQARTNNNNNKNNKSNHCQCLTLETITINNKNNNNNRVPREEIISTPIHQDGIPSILTVLVSMLIKNKLPDSQVKTNKKMKKKKTFTKIPFFFSSQRKNSPPLIKTVEILY